MIVDPSGLVACSSSNALAVVTSAASNGWSGEAIVDAATTIISAIAAVLAVFFAAKSIRETVKDRKIARTVTKKERLSRYYDQTVAQPAFTSIEAFQEEASTLLGTFDEEMRTLDSSVTAENFKRKVKEAHSEFQAHFYDMRRELRGVVAAWQDRNLLDAITTGVENVQTECADPMAATSMNRDGVKVFDWQDPLYETTGELMRIIRRSDPLLQAAQDESSVDVAMESSREGTTT